MKKYRITRQAIEDLVKWLVKNTNYVRLLPKEKGVRVSLVGGHQADITLDVVMRSGEKMIEAIEKLNQQMRLSLEKLAGVEVRYSKITVRGLYDESNANEAH